MPAIRIIHRTPLPPAEAWRRLTDWERHGAQVPLTRTIIETEPPTHVGTRFTARTGVGRITFDDTMEVVRWQPPAPPSAGLVRLEKRGRAVTGWAEIEVRPLPSGGTEAHWREDLRVRGLPRLLDPLTVVAGRLVFTRALTRLLSPRPGPGTRSGRG
ncbi:SRPBCC family protein [Streptomyces sp. Isolate_45]|uniref:SRPBCC family protein n=1 Tax=Streptomyces sp. Isolate_45 TaxID=2950111 RepID=UPI002481FD4E|nr:SRPBCC family protein [Streptomyces sp. Isolate_45]MDA5280724.1 SRPBCC family protein [Streptomyces sp. Isolate_45]